MVRWLISLCWLCGTGLALATGQLHVELPGSKQPYAAELGRAFTVQLHYRGEADLEPIRLDPWQADFAIDRGYVRRTDNDQHLRVRLTPRRTGRLSLASLQLGPASSEVLTVQIGPAVENGETLEPQWRLAKNRAWQGEELLASLHLDSHDQALRLETAELRWHGMSHRALPLERQPLPDGRTRYQLRWLLRPLAAGNRPVAAPELRYLRDGVPRRRFRFPVERLQVRPLPDYLPPNLAIGRLATEMDPQGRHWLVGHGIPAVQLQATLDRAGLSHRGLAEKQTAEGTRSRALLDWAGFRGNRARLVFFDPAVGRVSQLDLAAPATPRWPWLLAPPALLLAWLFWQRRRLGRWLRRVLQRRRLLAGLATTTEPLALKQALISKGQTLGQWQSAWQEDFRAPAGLAAVVQDLSACCYGQRCYGETAERLRQAIAQSRPRW